MQIYSLKYQQYCTLLLSSLRDLFLLLGLVFKLSFKFLPDLVLPYEPAIKKTLKKGVDFFRYPYYKVYYSFKDLKTGAVKAKKERDLLAAVSYVFCSVCDALFGANKILETLFNLSIVAAAALLFFVTSSAKTNYAYGLYIDDGFFGYVENANVPELAKNIVNERLSSLETNKEIPINTEIRVTTAIRPKYVSAYDAANYILENSGVRVEYAFGVYIDDKFVCAVSDTDLISKTLDKMLADYRVFYNLSDEDNAEFTTKVKYDSADLYLPQNIYSQEEVIQLLKSTKTVTKQYVVKEDYTPEMLAGLLGIPMDSLIANNEGFAIGQPCPPNTVLEYTQDVPYISIAITRWLTAERFEPIEYVTEYREDPSRFVGEPDIVKEDFSGEDGEKITTTRIKLINDVEYSREVIKEEVVLEPVNRVILRASKEKPVGPISYETASKGNFIWPVLHSAVKGIGGWGSYAGHRGVDFMAAYHTPIFAGMDGVVTKVTSSGDWAGGWGNHVVINHGNGISTLYAHMSETAATVGQQVVTGQCIGYVGQTGKASGNHVHLEVIVGGVKVNPAGYLDGI